MAIYRFQIEMPFSAEEAAARLRRLVTEPLENLTSNIRFWDFFRAANPMTPAFRGKITPEAFYLRQNLRWLKPLNVNGRISPVPNGANLVILIYGNPISIAAFIIWLTVVAAITCYAIFAPADPYSDRAGVVMGLTSMFVLGVTIMCVPFFPCAFEIRRMIEETLAQHEST
jgi:hypothetical protein